MKACTEHMAGVQGLSVFLSSVWTFPSLRGVIFSSSGIGRRHDMAGVLNLGFVFLKLFMALCSVCSTSQSVDSTKTDNLTLLTYFCACIR